MVIPVYDSNPVRRAPVVTYTLILVCVAVFLLEPSAGLDRLTGQSALGHFCSEQSFLFRWAAIPKELLTNSGLPLVPGRPVLDPSRAAGCSLVRPSYDKVPVLSVLSAMFLHGGWLHLIGNMLFLYVFGNNIEDRLGRLRFLAFYLVCGYAATYAYAAFYPRSTSTLVGASGAIAGVLGAYLVLYPRARVVSLVPFLFFLPLPLPAWLVLGSWFVLQYFYVAGAGMSGGADVAYIAHVIGFLVGAALVWPLRRRGRPTAPAYGGRF